MKIKSSNVEVALDLTILFRKIPLFFLLRHRKTNM